MVCCSIWVGISPMSLTQFLAAFRYSFFLIVSFPLSSSPWSPGSHPPFLSGPLQSSTGGLLEQQHPTFRRSFFCCNHSEGSLFCFRLTLSPILSRILLLSSPVGGCLIAYSLCPAFGHSETRDLPCRIRGQKMGLEKISLRTTPGFSFSY